MHHYVLGCLLEIVEKGDGGWEVADRDTGSVEDRRYVKISIKIEQRSRQIGFEMVFSGV